MKSTKTRNASVLRVALVTFATALLLAFDASAQDTDDPTDGYADEGEMSIEEIARMLDNPLGNLWIIFMQNDLAQYGGRPTVSRKWVNTGLIQPILPVPLTEKWNLVTRPIIPIVNAPEWSLSVREFGDCPGNCNSDDLDRSQLIGVSSDRKTELGDIFMWSMLSPADPIELSSGGKFVWGLGPGFRFPSATHDKFGSEKFSMGPANILMRLPGDDERWTLGLFHQHLFSVAGQGNRESVKQSQFQYIYWWSPPIEGQWSIGAAPMVDVNWEADSDNKLSFPVGLGLSNTFFVGPMPVRLGLEFNYFVAKPENFGPRYLFKFYVVPVIPRLINKPLFGG